MATSGVDRDLPALEELGTDTYFGFSDVDVDLEPPNEQISSENGYLDVLPEDPAAPAPTYLDVAPQPIAGEFGYPYDDEPRGRTPGQVDPTYESLDPVYVDDGGVFVHMTKNPLYQGAWKRPGGAATMWVSHASMRNPITPGGCAPAEAMTPVRTPRRTRVYILLGLLVLLAVGAAVGAVMAGNSGSGSGDGSPLTAGGSSANTKDDEVVVPPPSSSLPTSTTLGSTAPSSVCAALSDRHVCNDHEECRFCEALAAMSGACISSADQVTECNPCLQMHVDAAACDADARCYFCRTTQRCATTTKPSDCTSCSAYSGSTAACGEQAGCAFCAARQECIDVKDPNRPLFCPACEYFDGQLESCASFPGCSFCRIDGRCRPQVDSGTCLVSPISLWPVAGHALVALSTSVSVTFSEALQLDTAAAQDAAFLLAGGDSIAAIAHVSADARTLTLFPKAPLPAQSTITVQLEAAKLVDTRGRLVDLDADGLPGGALAWNFTTVSLATTPGTAMQGWTFTSYVTQDALELSEPLANVTITVDGAEGLYTTRTDETGFFLMDPSPAGHFFVYIQGHTATNFTGEPNFYFPTLEAAWVAEPGHDQLQFLFRTLFCSYYRWADFV